MLTLSPTLYAAFDRIADSCGDFWTLDDAMAATASFGISREYLSRIHQRLEVAGMVRRVRKGLYSWPTAQLGVGAASYPIAQKIAPRSTLGFWTALRVADAVGPDPELDRIVMSASSSPVVTEGSRRAQRMLDAVDDEFPGEVGPPPSPVGELVDADARIGMGRHLPASQRRAIRIDDVRFVFCRVRPGQVFGNTMLELENVQVRSMAAERAIVACYECPKLLGAEKNFTVLAQVLPKLELRLVAKYAERTGNTRAYKALDADLARLLRGDP